jgi:CubicO group peptidase (beta-lactamase class C family)
VAIGLVDGNQTHMIFAGKRSLEGPLPDENTIFEIGSVTKTFTGLILADAVVRGEVQLDQPVGELLGSDVRVPQFEEQPIRLVDLATQSSALPRLPNNMGFFNPLNPYASYTDKDLHEFLADYKLSRAPGKKYDYSNLGVGLLGHALAKRAGKTYEELLKERVCEPLKMSDTTITLSDDRSARMASGVSAILGIPAMKWDFGSMHGCGAIRSTLHDMLIYLHANLAPGDISLAKAIELAHEPRFEVISVEKKDHSYKFEIGLAWQISTEDGQKIVWHNGMTGGYASYLALVPEKKRGIVVLANTATGAVDELGNDLLKEMLKRK